jgi:hypothetical protein
VGIYRSFWALSGYSPTPQGVWFYTYYGVNQPAPSNSIPFMLNELVTISGFPNINTAIVSGTYRVTALSYPNMAGPGLTLSCP